MKANFTLNFKIALKAIVLTVTLGVYGFANAQNGIPAALQGGTTYYVDGIGANLDNVKDTFQSLSGTYSSAINPVPTSAGLIPYLQLMGSDPATIGTITIMLAPGYSTANAGSGYVELNPMSLDATGLNYPGISPNRPVQLKCTPGYNYTITTSTILSGTSSLFRLSGVSYFTIDGQATLGQKNLTFQMNASSFTNTIKVIDIIPQGTASCNSITIQNCNIVGSSTTATVYPFAGIYLGGVSAPSNALRRSNNIIIQNNVIKAVTNGVYIRGCGPANSSFPATTGYDLGLVVRGNTIGGTIAPGGTQNTDFLGGGIYSTGGAGIYLAAQANALVENNIVRNSINSVSYFGNFRGIALSVEGGATAVDSGVTVNRNRIYNINTSYPGQGSYGIRMNMGSHTQPLSISFTNNTIGNITASNAVSGISGLLYPIGISIEDNSANVGASISHNSINLYGSLMANNTNSGCVNIGATVSGGIVLTNNILANRMGRASSATLGGTINYCVIVNNVSAVTPNPFTLINGNDYYVNNFDGGNSFLGYAAGITGNKQLVSINHWRNFTTQDAASISAIPPFLSDTLLDLNSSTSSIISTSGISGTGVGLDVNGNARSLTTPSIGAFEFTSNPLAVNVPLTAGLAGIVYPITGTGNAWPTLSAPTVGSFNTLSDAISYLNAYGTSGTGSIIFELAASYTGEGSKYLPAIIDYPNALASRTVTIRPALGVNDTLTIPNQANFNYSSVLRFIGARYITVDGRNQNMTILMPSLANNITGARCVAITPSDQSATTDITIKNCIITGNSSPFAINTFAGIYLGHYAPASGNAASAQFSQNNNIFITNNLIQAVRTGIYLRGPNIGSGQSQNVFIGTNRIGGDIPYGGSANTTYLGGAASMAGIFMKGISNSIVDGNIIKNSASAISNDFRGIDMDALSESGTDSSITVKNNQIYNLTSTSVSCVGIRVYLGVDTLRNLSFINNFIGKIQGIGAGTFYSTSNPNGFIIDGTTQVSNIGVTMYYNTIQLSGKTLNGNSGSSCLYLGANIRGGLIVRNNLLVNALGTTTGTTGYAYAIQTGAASNPLSTAYGIVNSNVYYAGGAVANNFVGYAAGINYSSLGTWKAYTLQDTSSYSSKVLFVSDTVPDVQLATAGPVFYGGVTIPSVNYDIYSNIRFGFGGYNRTPAGSNPCIGAVEFGQPYSGLTGGATYNINGIQNPPLKSSPGVGSFQTISKAFQYLIANGVVGNTAPATPVKLLISSGYAGEGDTLILPLTEYPNMNANRVVVLTTDSQRTITTLGGAYAPYNNSGSVIRFSGASYFTIDGSMNGTTSRDLTIALPSITNTFQSLKVIDLIPGNVASTNITIQNCNILGSSTTIGCNTFAGIYSGGTSAAAPYYIGNPAFKGSNNNSFINNFIGGVHYGIYLRGVGSAQFRGLQDVGNIIRGNNIGGNINTGGSQPTNFWGGFDQSAAIFLSAQSAAIVENNVIKNNIRTNNQVRGIEFSNVSGVLSVDSGVMVSKNNIYNLVTNQPAIWGMYLNIGSDSIKNNTIVNNWISGISASGTFGSPGLSFFNPAAIYVDATTNIFNLGLNIWFNSINFGPSSAITGTTYGLVNASSSANGVQFSPLIRGGISLKNNIIQNRLPHTATANPSTSYAVVVGANSPNIFSACNNNNYFSNSTGPGTNNLMAYNSAVSPVILNTVNAISGYTNQDTSSMSFVTSVFTSDTVLTIPGGTTSVLVNRGSYISSVTTDYSNNPRPFTPTIGAVEFGGNPIDSLAPKLYNFTPASCGYGPFTIDLRAYANTITADTLYYMIYPNPTIYKVQAYSVIGNRRLYTIPTAPANSLILYKDTLWGALGLKATEPLTTGWDTIATSINSFPYGYGFDAPNVNNWTVQQVSGNGGWILGSYGSNANPANQSAYSGTKVALFGNGTAAATPLPSGTRSRLVSPCFDISTANLPTLRFWVSQNADQITLRDTLIVNINLGTGWIPVTGVMRPNPNYTTPGYMQVDVCLSSYVGSSSLRIGLEAISRGGNNFQIDSIMMIDNSVNSTITPKTNTICGYDSLTLNIANSQPSMSYMMYNFFTNAPLSNAYQGNGGTLTMKAANPNVDSVWVKILATNTLSVLSGCYNFMNDTAKINIKLFKNGPFTAAGTPFGGAYNAGVYTVPNTSNTYPQDGGKVYDTLTYNLVPPSGLTNADYGTKWTVVSTSIKTVTNIPATNTPTYIAPTPLTSGKYTWIVAQTSGDSLFYLNIKLRLLPTGCDSTIIRVIKITSAPLTSFSNGGKDTACRGAAINFLSTTPQNPATMPYVYAWDFGDGTTSTNSAANKVYTISGTYAVKLTVTNNAGLFTTVSKTFTVLVSPKSSFTNSKPCNGDTVVFTNSTTGAVSYNWTYSGGYGFGTSSAVNPHIYLSTPIDTGTYFVQLVSTNSLGCRDTAANNVLLFAKPHAQFTISNHCLGSVASIVNGTTILGANNSFGSVWYSGNGDTALSNNPTFRYNNNGTFTMRLKVTSNYGCVDSASQVVTVYDKPRSGFTYDTTTTCQFSNMVVNNTTTFAAGNNKVLYLWKYSDGTLPANDFNPVKSFGVIGNYTITLIATDTVYFCTDSTVKTVTISTTPVAQFDAPTGGCANNAVPFVNRTFSLATDSVKYAWKFGDGGTSNLANPSHTYTTFGNDTVSLRATAKSGCTSAISKVLSISSSPSITFKSDTIDAYSTTLIASSNIFASYVWTVYDGTNKFIETAYRDTMKRVFNSCGYHAVVLKVTDNNGCSGTDSASIASKRVYTRTCVGVEEALAAQYNVNVYPNPFSQTTNISYNLESTSNVHIRVFDMLGRVVYDLDKGNQAAGKHVDSIDADSFVGNSAVYLVRIQIDGNVVTRQILKQK
ncbi:MAG: PKD domain-containing protein [Bacteroidota bacterium]